MSGSLNPEIAQAAARLALKAEHQASGLSWPEFLRRRARTWKAPATERQGLPVRTWAAMELNVRTAFVMLGLDREGDPRAIASQSWDCFTDREKASLASIAREFQAATVNARCLW